MRVRCTQEIEDANEFYIVSPTTPLLPIYGPQPFTIAHRVRGARVIRVDRITPQHGVVELPEQQAMNLIRLGYAVAAE